MDILIIRVTQYMTREYAHDWNRSITSRNNTIPRCWIRCYECLLYYADRMYETLITIYRHFWTTDFFNLLFLTLRLIFIKYNLGRVPNILLSIIRLCYSSPCFNVCPVICHFLLFRALIDDRFSLIFFKTSPFAFFQSILFFTSFSNTKFTHDFISLF